MPGDLAGSQLSSLLEAVPGLASVLRSPVADAIVNVIRAAVGMRDFDVQDARELLQYATRRGLIPSEEGAQLLAEVEAGVAERRLSARKKATAAKPAKQKAAARTPKSTGAKKESGTAPVRKPAAAPVKKAKVVGGGKQAAKKAPTKRR